MTTSTAPAVTLDVPSESRLAQLLAQYDLAKAEAKKADEALEAIKNGIKFEMLNAAPGVEDIRANTPDLAKPLRLFAVSTTRLDNKKLQAEKPDVYNQYAVAGTTWQLREVS